MNIDPRSIDRHIGALVRSRRKALGISQSDLAAACGVTYQQIQKYESAATRISAGRLCQIADALGTSPAAFFIDFDISRVLVIETL